MNTRPQDASAAPDAERPSKTALKKHSHALQSLGEALMALPDARIDALGLPESLRDAVRTAQRTRSHEGRRRQLQYLGKLMRKADAAGATEAIRAAVGAFELGHARDALALHEAERWRAELVADDAALTRWMAAHPASDVQQLRSAIRSARKDLQATATPGAAPRQGRAWRELFKLLRAALNDDSKPQDDDHG